MKRRTARENAFIAAFSATFPEQDLNEIINGSREDAEYPVDEYGEAMLINMTAHRKEIDEKITSKLKDWTLARLPRTNATILRLAVCEMLYSDEDMDSIVINEAVEIAKKYCADEDYQFINGVLGSISRERSEAPEDKEKDNDVNCVFIARDESAEDTSGQINSMEFADHDEYASEAKIDSCEPNESEKV